MSAAQHMMNIERMPAARAASSPARLSSNTRQSAGATPSAAAPFRNPSGSGLDARTSSPPMRARGKTQSATPSFPRNESMTARGLDRDDGEPDVGRGFADGFRR